MKLLKAIVIVIVMSANLCEAAQRDLKITKKLDEQGEVIKGWESILLDPFTFESSIEFTNDVLKERTGGILSTNRTASELHKFSLNYEITMFDLFDGVRNFNKGLRETEKALDEIPSEINNSKLNTFLDSISVRAGGNWSNTASNIHEISGASIKSQNQFTGSVSITFKSCIYELLRKFTVGCPRK